MLTKKTKIICTMGPATDDDEVLKDLMRSGMDIARLNFSHGDHEEQLGRIKRIKKFREELNLPIAILLDTKGPEIRTGLLETDDDVELVTGQEYTLTTRDIKGNNEITSITYAELPQDVEAGNTILIDDGLIGLKVKEIKDGTDIVCDVINGGLLGSRKGVNVPNVRVNLPSITEKDKAWKVLKTLMRSSMHLLVSWLLVVTLVLKYLLKKYLSYRKRSSENVTMHSNQLLQLHRC